MLGEMAPQFREQRISSEMMLRNHDMHIHSLRILCEINCCWRKKFLVMDEIGADWRWKWMVMKMTVEENNW